MQAPITPQDVTPIPKLQLIEAQWVERLCADPNEPESKKALYRKEFVARWGADYPTIFASATLALAQVDALKTQARLKR
jgi:hypothetical protein